MAMQLVTSQDHPIRTISELETAIKCNRVDQIQNSLSRYGVPKNNREITDYLILQMAMKMKKTEIAKLLINAGCRVNPCYGTTRKESGYSPLGLAVQSEDEEMVTFLLKKGANWNAGCHCDFTVLHFAALNESLKMLNFLVDYQIDIDVKSNGKSPFHLFLEYCYDICEKQNPQIVRLFLKKGASTNFKTRDGQTVLHYVAKMRQYDIIKYVLEATYHVNDQSSNKNTALHNLLNANNHTEQDIVDVIKQFISKGANLKIQNFYGDTVVHLAAKKKYLLILQIFFDYEWNVNCYNDTGNTALHCILMDSADLRKTTEYLQIVERILEQDSLKLITNVEGKTPVHIAAENRQSQVLNYMLSKSFDFNAIDNHGNPVFDTYMKNLIVKKIVPGKGDIQILKKMLAVGVNTANCNKASIFHYCAVNMRLDILNSIISFCKNPDIVDPNKNTILHALLTHNMNTSQEVEKKVAEIVEALLSKGAKVTAVNDKGETPLHLAARAKHFESSKALLQKGAIVAELDGNGNSVLHFLCMLQCKTDDAVEERLTELFVRKGCDINARNKDGMTPLLTAARFGSVNMIRMLVKHNAKMNCVEKNYLSKPIHLAVENNHWEVILQLLQYGIDVNARRRGRKTPLHLSVISNLPKVTRLLFEHGADPDLKDRTGKTPLHLACKYDNSCINELLDFGADVNAEDNSHVTPLVSIKPSPDSYMKLRCHVIKLTVAGMHISDRNTREIDKLDGKYEGLLNSSKMKDFEAMAIEELLIMKRVSFGPRTLLPDVLLMSDNKFLDFKSDFEDVLYLDKLKKHLPIYADLMRGCYKKGIIRNDLITSAKGAFKKMLGFSLPDACYDAIFYYLDNENLRNLNETVNVKIRKRKRATKINESTKQRA